MWILWFGIQNSTTTNVCILSYDTNQIFALFIFLLVQNYGKLQYFLKGTIFFMKWYDIPEKNEKWLGILGRARLARKLDWVKLNCKSNLNLFFSYFVEAFWFWICWLTLNSFQAQKICSFKHLNSFPLNQPNHSSFLW